VVLAEKRVASHHCLGLQIMMGVAVQQDLPLEPFSEDPMDEEPDQNENEFDTLMREQPLAQKENSLVVLAEKRVASHHCLGLQIMMGVAVQIAVGVFIRKSAMARASPTAICTATPIIIWRPKQ
jgi:hypothetical protein